MEKKRKIVREFRCTTEVGDTITYYTHRAIVRPSYSSCYLIVVFSEQYKHGRKVFENKAIMYFDSSDAMSKEFEYTYGLCKNGMYTKSIEMLL